MHPYLRHSSLAVALACIISSIYAAQASTDEPDYFPCRNTSINPGIETNLNTSLATSYAPEQSIYSATHLAAPTILAANNSNSANVTASLVSLSEMDSSNVVDSSSKAYSSLATSDTFLASTNNATLAQSNANSSYNNQDNTPEQEPEVYSVRHGKFDVSVILDNQGQHKFSPEQEAQRQAEMQQRNAQERATAEALANPHVASQYVQSNINEHTQSMKQDILQGVPNGLSLQDETQTASTQLDESNQNTSEQTTIGQGKTEQSKTLLKDDPWADMLDPSQPIDMTLIEQTLQLNILDSKTAPAHYSQLVINLEHPTQLKESFILAGDKYVLSYAETSGAFAITYTLRALSPEQAQDFQDNENFKAALTQRFHDKEKLLYGEYTIVNELNFPTHKELTLKGFLKKPEDGILPDMQNYFYERTVIDKGYIATISCEFRGSQAQAAHTSMRFDVLEPLCKRIVDGYRYEFKTATNR